MNISDNLKMFYIALQAWIDAGTPARNTFKFCRHTGICFNAGQFDRKMGFNELVYNEVIEHLSSRSSDTDYPFNGGQRDEYTIESQEYRLYQNPQRLAWVKEHSQ